MCVCMCVCIISIISYSCGSYYIDILHTQCVLRITHLNLIYHFLNVKNINITEMIYPQ